MPYQVDTLDPLNLPGYYSEKDVHDLIPIGKRSNFNDSISIEVGYTIDDTDIKAIRDYLRKECGFEWTREFREFSVERRYTFADSKLNSSEPSLFWGGANFFGKKKRARNERQLLKPEWTKVINFMKSLLPSILLLPQFSVRIS